MTYGLRTTQPRITQKGKVAHKGQYVYTGNGDPDIYTGAISATGSYTSKTTVSFWVGCPNNSGADHELFWGYDDASNYDMFRYDIINRQMRLHLMRLSSDVVEVRASINLTVGVWNHVLLATDIASTGSRQLWINGVQDVSANWVTWSALQPRWPADLDTMHIAKSLQNGSPGYDFALAQFWQHNDLIDCRVNDKIYDFISREGELKPFAPDGSTPIGAQPKIYWEGYQNGNYLSAGGSMFSGFTGGGGSRMPEANPIPAVGLSFTAITDSF